MKYITPKKTAICKAYHHIGCLMRIQKPKETNRI